MLPSFHGAFYSAIAAGDEVVKCHHCDGWVWWNWKECGDRPFHDHGVCQLRENALRSAERGE